MAQSSPNAQALRRVALIDDHEVVAAAFASVVSQLPGFEFVGVAATVPELLERFNQVDLVVLDLRLADGSSPANNVEQLRASGANVLVFTSGESPYLVRSVAKTSILGVIRKSAPVASLLEALTRAAIGEVVISTDWAAAVASDPDLKVAGLSAKEQQVLVLFADGFKAQQVAQEAGIAVATVEDYVRRIRAKYARVDRDAPTKIDLYKRAVEDGFLPLPGDG
jgi:two-component system response regulator DevR